MEVQGNHDESENTDDFDENADPCESEYEDIKCYICIFNMNKE